MTTLAIQPTPTITPPPEPQPTLIPTPYDLATPTLYISDDATEFTISVREPCRHCDGEGALEVDIPGGVWTSCQGGMWVPDSRRVECEACDGRGYFTRTRCARCGHYHPNDEWGISAHETECQCDPEDVQLAVVRHARLRSALTNLQQAAQGVKRLGLLVLTSAHQLPWNDFWALAADAEARVRYVRRDDGSVMYDASVAPGMQVFSQRGEGA